MSGNLLAALEWLALGVPVELRIPGRPDPIVTWPDDPGSALRLLQGHPEITVDHLAVPDLNVQTGAAIPRHVRPAVVVPGASALPPAADGLPLDRIVRRLRERGYWVRRSGRSWRCRCPYHAGRSDRSLSLGERPDGVATVHCFERCRTRDVLAVLGLRLTDLYPFPVDLVHQDPECAS